MKRILRRSRRGSLTQRHAPRGLAPARGQFAHGAEFRAIPQAEVTHVAVESFHIDIRDLLRPRSIERRGSKARLRAFTTHRADDVDGPRRALLKLALD